MNKTGRPPFVIDEAVCKKAEALAAQGLSHKDIAHSLGISYQTFNEKSKDYPEFSDAIQSGKSKGLAQVTNALFKKATEGDVVAMKYYLNNRSPEWNDRQDIKYSGEVKHIQEKDDDAIQRELDDLVKRAKEHTEGSCTTH